MFTRRFAFLFVLAAAACSETPTDVPRELMPSFAVTVTTLLNQPYTNAALGTSRFDVYRSANVPALDAEAVVYVPGGAWQKCNNRTGNAAKYISGLPQRGPWVLYVPCYRVGLGIWPAQENDVRCFIKHLRWNATALGIDRNRIRVVGHSAGGHIANILARDAEPSLACYNGVSSVVTVVVAVEGPSNVKKLSGFNAETRLIIPKVFGDTVAQRLASPALTGGVCSNLMIIHGSADATVYVSNAHEMKAACPGAQLWIVPRMGHNLTPGYANAVMDSVAAHFKRN